MLYTVCSGRAVSADELSEAERAKRFDEAVGRASQCYRKSDFECALREFQRAHQINPRPLLLFNMAQVQRKAGHSQAALGLYERFLREDPQSELVPEVRAYANALREGTDSPPATNPDASSKSGGDDNFTGSEEDRQRLFRQYIEEAAGKYKAGEYDAAVGAYWAAYSLKPQTSIIFNVAQAYRKAVQWPEALSLFRRYLREEPASPLKGEIDGYIAEARARLQVTQIEAERQSAERMAKANQALAEQLAEVRAIERRIVAQSLAAQPKPIYRQPWFWAVVSSAAIGAALGIGLGVGLTRPSLPHSDLGIISLVQ